MGILVLFLPIRKTPIVSCWWGLIRQKQLSTAATAWVIWLCPCQTMGWCLSASLALIVWKEVLLLSICVKCVPILIKKNQDDPPLRGSWKLSDPPLTKGSKTDDPPTLCSGPWSSYWPCRHLKRKSKSKFILEESDMNDQNMITCFHP